MLMQKLRDLKKIIWSQMIQNCLMQREMVKKIRRQTAVINGSGGTAAVFSFFRVATFNSNNLKKKIIIIKNANMA